jgi:EmrB/QacA subfamily drug resistance transporter
MTVLAPNRPEGGLRARTPDWVILTIACVAQFMVVLDVSVINVALPSIAKSLSFSPTNLQWTVNAYTLTFAGFLLFGGRAADLFGQRRIFLAGLTVFTVASLAGGVAQNSAWLVTARAFQGLGGAFLAPATLTIIITTYQGPRVAKALGVWSAVAAAGGAVGGLLSGVLTAELSWRWTLFINIPIGIAVGGAAVFFLREVRGQVKKRLDVAGAVSVTAGMTLLVYGIVSTDTRGWTSAATLLTLAGGVVLLALFVAIEQRGKDQALVPLDVLRSRSLTGANVVMLFVGAVFFSFWYFASLFVQDVLGFSALRTGLAFLPWSLAVVVGAQTASRIIGRVGPKPLILIGTVLMACAYFWFGQADAQSTYFGNLFAPGLLLSVSLGLLFAPLTMTATSGVPRERAGLASGLLNTSRQIGGSLGLAVLATLATSRIQAAAQHGTHLAALASGYDRAFLISALLTLLATVSALAIPARKKNPQAAGAGR